MSECLDHLEFLNETCPDCNLPVDNYGNTEAQYKYCSFPDCGCDGARLCQAGEASENALQGNVENMWSNGSNKKARKAALFTMNLCREEK